MNILISFLFLAVAISTSITQEPVEWWYHVMDTGLLSIIFLERALKKD